MDAISGKGNVDYAQRPHAHKGSSGDGEAREIKDEVTLSQAVKSSRSGRTKKKHGTKAGDSSRSHKRESLKNEATPYQREETAPGRSGCGPDDVCDDGACPGGGRTDNADNPDSVVDNGGCGVGYSGGGNYNYNGPDGSYNYDEYH